MCTNKQLVTLPNGLSQEVSCRTKCEACRRHRKRVYVGRSLSEMQCSDAAYVVTATYGRDNRYRFCDPLDSEAGDRQHRHAGHLHYPDVQLWMKRLRHNLVKTDENQPSSCRYLAAMEFGAAKGRAHAHVVVFLRNATIPNLRLYERYDHEALTLDQAFETGARYKRAKPLWQDGFSYWEPADALSISYVTKYVLKAPSDLLAKSIVHASAGLGIDFYRKLALRYVEAGLAPKDLTYQIPGHEKSRVTLDPQTGGIRQRMVPEHFLMSRSMGVHFLAAFVDGWRRLHGGHPMPTSEPVEWYLEKLWAAERLQQMIAGDDDPFERFMTVRDELAWERREQRWLERERRRSGILAPVGDGDVVVEVFDALARLGLRPMVIGGR